MNGHELIYGEQARDLLPALMKLKDWMRITRDGSYVFTVRMDLAEAAPLRRALMRVEAELLCEDADQIGEAGEVERTYDQRRADALVRLVTAIPAGRGTPTSPT